MDGPAPARVGHGADGHVDVEGVTIYNPTRQSTVRLVHAALLQSLAKPGSRCVSKGAEQQPRCPHAEPMHRRRWIVRVAPLENICNITTARTSDGGADEAVGRARGLEGSGHGTY